MKIQDLTGLTKELLLKEEESDYYRDYQRGLISYQEYQELVKQFQQSNKEREWEQRSRDRGPWYVTIDGQIYKQKGVPKVFDWRKGANNYALAMIKNKPELQGKVKLTKHLPADDQGVAEGGAQQAAIAIAKKESGKYDKDGKRLKESASAGATSAANIGTVDAPHISPGKARGKKSYIGSPGHSGTKAPPQPKIVQPKNKNGTAKNGLDIKSVSLFGGPKNKAKVIKRR